MMSSISADDYWSSPTTWSRGRLIVICGLDGAGKTTQIEALGDHCRQRNLSVCLTRQPTEWYRRDPFVQSYLKNGGNLSQSYSLALFAAADRHRHINEVIVPALSAGKIVISDRYVFSSLAYFRIRGVADKFVEYINRGIPRPDHTFFLDVPAAVLLKRLQERDGNALKFEEKSEHKLNELRSAFLSFKDLFTVIDGEQPKETIATQIINCVSLAD